MTDLPPNAPPPTPSETDSDAKQMAMLAHLLGFIGSFIPSLIIWQVKKNVPFVEQEAKEALNFQITVFIAYIATGIVGAFGSCLLHMFFFYNLPWLVGIVNLVFCIMAAMKAKDGIAYRYPFALRLIK